MKTGKFSLRSLVGWLVKKRPSNAVVLKPHKREVTVARERVRSGIEPLEGRIAPAVLLNGHTLNYNDVDGDLVTVTFSRDIFTMTSATLPAALKSVFKFSAGDAHIGAVNGTDDVNQQLQLIDLGAVPQRVVGGAALSVVGGVSFTITSEKNPASGLPLGDGLTSIGAIKAGNNALGSVVIDGDLGQIDAGVASSRVGVAVLSVQSIGKYGVTTQAALPTPDLNSEIKGKLGRLIVKDDMQGYLKVSNTTGIVGGVNRIIQPATIGQIVIGGSLLGNPTVAAASDNTGRIESAYDIGNVFIGTDATDGIIGGGGKSSGSLVAGHAMGNVTLTGNLEGGAGQDSGAIISNGTIGTVKIGGDLKGSSGLRSGGLTSIGAMGDVTIGSAAATHHILGGSGESTGIIIAGALGNLHVYGNITGAGGFHSGFAYSTSNIKSVVVDGNVTGGVGIGSATIEAVRSLGATFIGGDLVGGDGVGSGVVVAGSTLARITVSGDVKGGIGANSGAILGGYDPSFSVKALGNVSLGGALIGGEGIGSGSIASAGTIGAVRLGTALSSGLAVQGGAGALSGSITAHGTIASVTSLRGITGGSGAGSASIQSDGLLGVVSITGDLTGGSGAESASIFSHENANAARPFAGNIGTVVVTGKLAGVGAHSALIEADGAIGRAILGSMQGGAGESSGSIVSGAGFLRTGPTASIVVAGAIEGGAGARSGAIEIGAQLISLSAGSISGTEVRVSDDIRALRVNGDVTDSEITARGQLIAGATTDLAIGAATITGNVTNSRILAGYDTTGSAVNADAQIGAVRVVGNWTSSVLAAGVEDGVDGLFGTDDDHAILAPNSARIIAQIASVIVDGNVAGTSGSEDHFGFIAERIVAFKSNGTSLAMSAAPGQVFELGANGDTTVREVVQLV